MRGFVLFNLLFLAISLVTACGVVGQTAAPSAGNQAAGTAPAQANPSPGTAQQAAPRPGGAASGAVVPVSVAQVQQGAMRTGPTFSGDVVALQQVNLVPRATGVISRINVDIGNDVTGGQVVAELDHATQDAAVASAQAAVDSAQAKLDQILAGAKAPDLAKAQGAIDTAQANLDSANAKLNALLVGSNPRDIEASRAGLDTAQQKLTALQNGPRPEQVVVFQKAIEVAQNTLTGAQAQANGDCVAKNPFYVCDASRAKVNAAETALNQARLQYSLNMAPPTATDLAQAKNAVVQAQDALDKLINSYTPDDLTQALATVAAQQGLLAQARATADGVASPFTGSDIQVAQAAVRTARAQLDSARVTQQQTSVSAPFDGTISARLLAEGALATTTSPIFTLVSRNIGIDLAVSQEVISQLATGQQADVRTPGLPGQTISGVVYSVSPAADPRTRTFLVRVVPADQDGRLHPGMSASVSLNTVADDQAVLVPTDAIVSPTGAQGQGVFVVEDRGGSQVASFKTPSFGPSNGKMTQILGGLTLGDLVVIQGQASLSNNQGVRLIGGAAGATTPQRPGGAPAAPGARG